MNREPDAGRSASDGLLELHDVAGRVVVVPCVVELSAVAHQAMAAVVDPVDERFPRGHDALITSAVHRGGNFYHGQVDDTHGLAVRHVLFADVEARAQHDLAFGDGAAVVLVDADRDAGLGTANVARAEPPPSRMPESEQFEPISRQFVGGRCWARTSGPPACKPSDRAAVARRSISLAGACPPRRLGAANEARLTVHRLGFRSYPRALSRAEVNTPNRIRTGDFLRERQAS